MKLLRLFALGSVIIGIVAIVLFLRFYQLGSIPHGINVDEASYGYDAYSLLQSGKDMWGNRGSSLESFGDYKPVGLSYTLIPLIKYLGLSTTTTRLPSAIFGILTIAVAFFTLKYLLGNTLFAFLGSIILSLSPWHFGLSRLFYEPNSGLFFLAISILLEFKLIKRPTDIKYLIASSILVAFGGYYYSVLRYLGLGILGIAVLVAYFPSYLRLIKYGLLAIICWAIFASPYLGDMFGSRGLIRLQQEGNLHEFGDTLVITENRQMCYIVSGYNPTIAKLCYALWNKPGEKLIDTAKIYVQLLSPSYLFISGSQKDILPETSGAYLEILLPLYLLGIFYLTINLRKKREHVFILSSWLFAMIPVALAGAINIHRNEIGLYFVFLICAYGLSYLVTLISGVKPKIIKIALIIVFSLTYLWSQSRYLGNYYFVYTRMQPEIWLYDTPEIMNWLSNNRGNRRVYFYDYDFAPLYYSFYNLVDPHYFQQNSHWSEKNQYGWTHVDSIGTELQNQSNIYINICAHQNPLISSSVLVVTGGKEQWQSVVEKQFKNYTGIHVLHEIYDSKVLYDYLLKKDALTLKATCSNLK